MTKAWHIEAYTFNADVVCTDCIYKWAKDELRKQEYTDRQIYDLEVEGVNYDAGFFAFGSEALLRELARLRNINLEDSYSYDSDDFPKPIFSSDIEDEEICGVCNNASA